MSAPPSPSRAVTIGYGLVTLMLVVAVAFGAVAVASVAVGVARHGDSLLYGDRFAVPLELSPDDVGPLPRGVELRGWPGVNVQVTNPTAKQMLLRSGLDFGPLVLFVAGLWLGRGFLRSVLDGDPFGAANVQRLRAIGFVLVVGAPFVELFTYALRTALFSNVPPYPSLNLGSPGFGVPGNALLGGLGAFILAEVLAYGLRLREDVEATI
ncbi:MAG: hypothetical protein QOD24_3459 [Solirubrobacteraceae bacterium]|nr:hypothetical protein [Solirubrobacteraceae bacterium]